MYFINYEKGKTGLCRAQRARGKQIKVCGRYTISTISGITPICGFDISYLTIQLAILIERICMSWLVVVVVVFFFSLLNSFGPLTFNGNWVKSDRERKILKLVSEWVINAIDKDRHLDRYGARGNETIRETKGLFIDLWVDNLGRKSVPSCQRWPSINNDDRKLFHFQN